MSGKAKRPCRCCGRGLAAHRKHRLCLECSTRLSRSERRWLQKQAR